MSWSAVGSTDGSVTLIAGDNAHIGGSDVIAKKDISVVGGSVDIDPATTMSAAVRYMSRRKAA